MKKQTPECSSTVSMQHSTDVGHSKIMIRTVDTDVVVLATATIQRLSANCELWLSFRTGNNLLYLACHNMATQLGLEKARTLPTFHAMTGCGTVSSSGPASLGVGRNPLVQPWPFFLNSCMQFLQPKQLYRSTSSTPSCKKVMYRAKCWCPCRSFQSQLTGARQ